MDKGFLVFGDIEETLNELTDEQVAKLFRSMVAYHNTGEDPELSGVLKYVFIPIRQQMDRGTTIYKEKCEKNRQNRQKAWDRIKDKDEYERIRPYTEDTTVYDGYQTKTKTDTDAKTKTETGTKTESAHADVWALSLSVLSYLNALAGTSYRTDEANSVRLISELSHKGYTEEQMKDVVRKKCEEWLGDPKMEGYLRPSTLFKLTNFEKYLAAPDSARRKQREKDERDDRRYEDQARRIHAETERMKAEFEKFNKEHGLA